MGSIGSIMEQHGPSPFSSSHLSASASHSLSRVPGAGGGGSSHLGGSGFGIGGGGGIGGGSGPIPMGSARSMHTGVTDERDRAGGTGARSEVRGSGRMDEWDSGN